MTAPEPLKADTDARLGLAIGRAVRDARTERGLSMRGLARDAEISQPFLSQIESGQAMPSVVTLYRIANALGIAPFSLLPDEQQPDAVQITRRGQGHAIPVAESPGAAIGHILSSPAAHGVTVVEYRVSHDDYPSDWYQSAGGEITVYVAEGELAVTVEGQGEWMLGPGDAIAHSAALRNKWAVRSAQPATVLLVHVAETRA